MSGKAAITLFLEKRYPTCFHRFSPTASAEGASTSWRREMPPKLNDARDQVVHCIDALVPLRSTNFGEPVKSGGRDLPMLGVDLVDNVRRQIVSSHQLFSLGGQLAVETIYAFDDSANVPITKGPEQIKRAKALAASAGGAVTTSSSSTVARPKKELTPAQVELRATPLREVPTDGTPYITLSTRLSTLGNSAEVFADRLPLEDGEEQTYKVLPTGERFALKQGRRQQIVAFICYNLLRPADEENPEPSLDPEKPMQQATLQLERGHKVVLMGHCLSLDFFRKTKWNEAEGRDENVGWLSGFTPPAPGQQNDESIDWGCVPIVAYRNESTGDLEMTFSMQRFTTIGEAEVSVFSQAQVSIDANKEVGRRTTIVMESKDTDMLLYSLLYQRLHNRATDLATLFWRSPQRITPMQQQSIILGTAQFGDAESRAWPKYVDICALADALTTELSPFYDDPLECFVLAMLTRGSDYTLPFKGVTHERFFNALLKHHAFIGRQLVGPPAAADIVDPMDEVKPGKTPALATDGSLLRQIHSVSWLNLVMAAYSEAHHTRLLDKEKKALLYKTPQQVSDALNGQLPNANGKRVAPLAADKQMPELKQLLARFANTIYVFTMFLQVGTAHLGLPSTEEELRLHGFRPIDKTRPMSRNNIRFKAAAAVAEGEEENNDEGDGD